MSVPETSIDRVLPKWVVWLRQESGHWFR